jgi:peptidoglycan hydrolase-like protein with peptidoglycan-binding domain
MTLRQSAPERFFLVIAVIAVLAALVAVTGIARSSSPPPPLHKGSTGPRVKSLQWLLGGHKPNVFKLKTYRRTPNGKFDSYTVKAVNDYKRLLGYPNRDIRPTAGAAFVAILRGQKRRPAAWVALAKQRARHDNLPLRIGSSGPRVAGLQWMLAGHKPNVFTKVKGTFSGTPNGYFGPATAKAVTAYKYRIGSPGRYLTPRLGPIAGSDFLALLHGKKRPISWVAIAAKRLQLVVAGSTPLALRIKAVEISQLGASESYGYNRGPVVDQYSRYFGLPLGLAWCEIFQQWAFAHGGFRPPFGNRSFAVFYTVDWARNHGYLNAKAKVGALAAFLGDSGHIGYIVKVLASGYVTIEGNYNNRVTQVFHRWNDQLRVFIYLPGVA